MLRFKNLKIENLSELIALEQECFKFPWHEKEYREEFEKRNSLIFGAFLRAHNKLIAALVARHEKVIGECWIFKLMTNKKYRGRGVADLLLSQLEKPFAGSEILLEVNINNREAISLYEKNKYEITAKRPGYYPSLDLSSKKREDALIMRKLC